MTFPHLSVHPRVSPPHWPRPHSGPAHSDPAHTLAPMVPAALAHSFSPGPWGPVNAEQISTPGLEQSPPFNHSGKTLGLLPLRF